MPDVTDLQLAGMAAQRALVEFVFVHSYTSKAPNWQAVMIGEGAREGRVATAQRLAKAFQVPVIANDKHDIANHDLFEREGILNLGTALRTSDEVRSALRRSPSGAVLFVTSPDHLPRVARDALAAGGSRALFASSEVPMSNLGPAAVAIDEPIHDERCLPDD